MPSLVGHGRPDVLVESSALDPLVGVVCDDVPAVAPALVVLPAVVNEPEPPPVSTKHPGLTSSAPASDAADSRIYKQYHGAARARVHARA